MNIRVLCVVLLPSLAFTAPAQAADHLIVVAASSLTDVLPRVAEAWKRSGGVDMDFSFDASSHIGAQLGSGAPADLFFSGDEEWMDFAASKHRVDTHQRIDLLTNELVIVVPANSHASVASPADLAKLGHVALAGENVPAGRYARQALRSLGVWAGVEGKVVNGSNVRQTLELAARGDVEAAVVFRTDAQIEPKVRVAFTFPASSHEPILYPVAVMADAPHAAEAARFLAFCQTAEARRIFEAAGFGMAKR